jgi:hypothetical protein
VELKVAAVLEGAQFHFLLVFHLIFENFKRVRFTVLIFQFIFDFIFDGLCLQKQTKNGSKMRSMSTPNDF